MHPYTETKNTNPILPLPFKDKNGNQLFPDDIIYNGQHYYRIYWSHYHNEHQAITCTNGYMHDIKQEDLKDFVRIGRYLGNEHLFQCD